MTVTAIGSPVLLTALRSQLVWPSVYYAINQADLLMLVNVINRVL